MERIDYADIGEIINYIIDKVKSNDTDLLQDFFNRVETILNKCDDYTKDLIVVGLLEGIQNVCGWEKLDYHNGFNPWLKPETKKAWEEIIFWWESDEAKQKWEEYKKNQENNKN